MIAVFFLQVPLVCVKVGTTITLDSVNIINSRHYFLATTGLNRDSRNFLVTGAVIVILFSLLYLLLEVYSDAIAAKAIP